MLRYDDHTGWKTSKIIPSLISLGSSLSPDSNIVSLLQRDCHENLAGIGVMCGKSRSRRTNYVTGTSSARPKLYTSNFSTASRGFPATVRLSCLQYFEFTVHFALDYTGKRCVYSC